MRVFPERELSSAQPARRMPTKLASGLIMLALVSTPASTDAVSATNVLVKRPRNPQSSHPGDSPSTAEGLHLHRRAAQGMDVPVLASSAVRLINDAGCPGGARVSDPTVQSDMLLRITLPTARPRVANLVQPLTDGTKSGRRVNGRPSPRTFDGVRHRWAPQGRRQSLLSAGSLPRA